MTHRDFYTKILASTSVFLFLILFLSTASAAVAQSASLAGTYAYITNIESHNVSVIDTSNNTLVTTIPVGVYPYGVTVSPDGLNAYVANQGSNTVSVINTTTNEVSATVDVGKGNWGIAVSPDGKKVYVTNYNWGYNWGQGPMGSTVSVINTVNNTISATVTVGNQPCGVAVSPDGSKVYVTNIESNDVSVIETTTNNVISTIPVGTLPWGVAASPDGTKVYVANCNSNTVSVIDTSDDTIAATIPVGASPYGIAVSPDGSKVYVTNFFDNNVSVINTTNNSVVDTVYLEEDSHPHGISFTPDGKKVYVASQNGNVHVINTADNNVTATVQNVGVNPIAFGQFIRKSVPFSWEFSPQEPVSGDILNINGSASPGEKVGAFVTYEKAVPVSKGKFEYTLEDVKIPEGFNNLFTVEAKGAKNLNVRVKMVLWVTKSSKASGYTATVSQSNVPPGTYKIKIDGNAGEGVSEVNLKITAFQKIKADSNGNFSYSYNTTEVPTGDFEVKIGDITKEITIKPKETEQPSSVLPMSNFSSNVTEGYAPLTVKFTDLSTNATGCNWDFENDRVIDSTDRNPIYRYTVPGNYTVNLTATNVNGTNSTFATIVVLQKPVPFSWEFSPQEPVSGDILNINGSASPGEKVGAFVTYEKAVPVSKGKFEYILEDVKIPEGFNNLFTVEAKGAKNLNVRVKMVLWVTKSSKASGYTATVSQSNVSPGTYKIKIDGNAGEGVSEVNLKITAFQKIKADSNGNFSYSYNTTAVPPGNFEVKVGDITKEITLKPKEIEEPSLVLPFANFSSDVTEGYAPLTVQFTDLSENATYVSWDFGDRKNSSERNPVHKFTTQGTYTVNLTANNGNGTDSKSAIINVTKKPIYWEFSPQEPVSGDILNINGSTSPGEKVDVFATFEKTVPVSGGKFEYNLKDVEIPEGFNNLFTVEAKGAKNLNVRVKIVLWVTKSLEASGDTAVVSQSNVPPGTYKIKIDGEAGKGVSEVNLKITALQKIKADSNGNFSCFYNTTAVPPGNFEVKVGDITKEITLRPKEIVEPSLVLPFANFSSDVTEGYAPLTVQFTDLSENATYVSWDFGDGTNSTQPSPMHTYSSAGNYTVNLTTTNQNGTDSKPATINVVTSLVIPPLSIDEIRSSPESTWIKWTWTNPDDSNFDHTEIYLNGTFQANISAEYFNTTNLQPKTDYIIGTRTADVYGNVNETWVNASAKTKPLPDVAPPVIESVTLFPANTTAGSKMDINANIKDNIGVAEVTAGNVQLMNVDGNWQGNIIAPSSVGKYSLLIRAKDSAGNTVSTSVPYSVIRRKGSVIIEVLPTVSNVVAGKNTNLAIKVKDTQNIDDTFKVQISSNGLLAFYQAGVPWFSWTEKTVNLRANQEVLIPIEVKVPAGTATGFKLFRTSASSETSTVSGLDTGYLVISHLRHL